MKLRFTIELDDVLEIEMDNKTVYLKAQCLCAGSTDDAHYLSMQSIDNKGKCRIFELRKVKELPKGWKSSGFTRFKL